MKRLTAYFSRLYASFLVWSYILIIKEVGINGLIAIKNDYLRGGGGNFYNYIKRYDNEFTVYSSIYCHLTMVKDFAQYQ